MKGGDPPWRRTSRLLAELIAEGAVSAAVVLAGGPRRIEVSLAAGPATIDTWFDYGSLTKPFVATLALLLDRTGELPLAARVGEVFPRAAPRVAGLALGDLLRHRARFAAWTPLYARCRTLADVEALLLSGDLLGARAGTYSDLDYLLWGLAAERATGSPLGELIAARVLGPLGLGGAVATAPGDPGGRPEVAVSRMDTGREVALAAAQGLVIEKLPPPPAGSPQDGNLRFLGELAAGEGRRTSGRVPGGRRLWGHGGLFGTAAGLWRLGAEWLAPGILLRPEEVAAALAGPAGQVGLAGKAGQDPFALGWWRRRHRGGGGPALSAGSFGHTGFAGGSLWIDPERERVFVLLAHRIDPQSNLNRWRRRFHAAANGDCHL